MSLSRPFWHRSDHLQNHRSWSWSQESDPYLLQYRHQKLLRLLCPCNQCLQCHHLLQLCLLLLHLDSASDWSGSSGLLHRLLLPGQLHLLLRLCTQKQLQNQGLHLWCLCCLHIQSLTQLQSDRINIIISVFSLLHVLFFSFFSLIVFPEAFCPPLENKNRLFLSVVHSYTIHGREKKAFPEILYFRIL